MIASDNRFHFVYIIVLLLFIYSSIYLLKGHKREVLLRNTVYLFKKNSSNYVISFSRLHQFIPDIKTLSQFSRLFFLKTY